MAERPGPDDSVALDQGQRDGGNDLFDEGLFDGIAEPFLQLIERDGTNRQVIQEQLVQLVGGIAVMRLDDGLDDLAGVRPGLLC